MADLDSLDRMRVGQLLRMLIETRAQLAGGEDPQIIAAGTDVDLADALIRMLDRDGFEVRRG